MAQRADDPTDDGGEKRRTRTGIAVLAAIAALAALDLADDLSEGTTLGHAVIEGSIILMGAIGVAALLRRLADLRSSERQARRDAEDLAAHLAGTREEASRWRGEVQNLLAGLGVAIDRQLDRWGLSAAEKSIALLLLKGLSHKEVANARGVGEATVRQQARSIYKKAGLGGRHDLAAFFLEDLLAPLEPRSHGEATRSATPPVHPS